MAITNTVQLPAQPSPTGTTRFTALGGNGFSAPKGMYQVRNFASTGDGVGGAHTHEIIMDPDYCSMIGYCTMLVNPAAGATQFAWNLVSADVPAQVITGSVTPISVTIDGPAVSDLWMPPAFVSPGGPDAPTLRISKVEILNEVLTLNAVIFIFDIRAREFSKYGDLIAARGGMYERTIGL